MPVALSCPKCGKPLQVPDTAVGKQVKCPCGAVFPAKAPAAKASPFPAAPQPHKVSVSCTECAAKVSIPATAAGEALRCPKCGVTFTAGARKQQVPARPETTSRKEPARKPAKKGGGVLVFGCVLFLLLTGGGIFGAWYALHQGYFGQLAQGPGAPTSHREEAGSPTEKETTPEPVPGGTGREPETKKEPETRKEPDTKKEPPTPVPVKFSPNPVPFDPKRQATEKVAIPVIRSRPWGYGERREDMVGRLLAPSFVGVTSVAFSPKDNVVAGLAGDAVFLWDLGSTNGPRRLPGNPAYNLPGMIAFSPDGALLASAGSDKSVRVVQVATGEVVKTLTCTHGAQQVAFTADGSTLAVMEKQSEFPGVFLVETWSVAGWEKKTLEVGKRTQPMANLSPSGNFFLHGAFHPGVDSADSATIDVWHLPTGEKKTFTPKWKNRFLAMGRDDRTLIVSTLGEKDPFNTSDIWTLDITTGETKRMRENLPARVDRIEMTPDGKHLFLNWWPKSGSPVEKLVELKTNKSRWCRKILGGYSFVSPGGALLLRPGAEQLEVYAVEEMLGEAWADLEDNLDQAIGMGFDVGLYNGQVRVKVENAGEANFEKLVSLLPGITSIEMKSPPTSKMLASLKGLGKLGELKLANNRSLTDTSLAGLGEAKALKRLDLTGCGMLTDAGLAGLAGLENLEWLKMTDLRAVQDDGLKHLAGLKKLRSLDLTGMESITDAGLAHVAGLSELHELSIARTKVTGVGLAHLAGLANLERLEADGRKITDDDLAHVAKLTKMRDLGLPMNAITDAGLVHLKGMAGLRRLSLIQNAKVSGTGFADLQGLKDLEKLSLAGTGFTDAGLAHLKGYGKLEELSLDSTAITDAGLAQLSGLTSLKAFTLHGSRVRGDGLRHLKDCTSIKFLFLNACYDVTDAGLAGIKDWKHLELLSMPPNVSDKGFVHLKGLEKLTSLEIERSNAFRGPGLASLKDLPALQRLVIRDSNFLEDAGLSSAAGLQQITSLDLGGCKKLTAKSLSHLRGMKNLKAVTLPNNPSITEAEIKKLREALPGASIFKGLF